MFRLSAGMNMLKGAIGCLKRLIRFSAKRLFQKKYSINHLIDYSELACGPIQSDEALFLYGLVKVIRSKVIIEFGFAKGHSSINFLKALTPDGLLYSFDCDETCKPIACSIKDPRFRFIFKRGEDFQSVDINNRSADIIFIDASHVFNLNVLLFEKILNCLNQDTLVVIHDTGSWNKELIPKSYTRWTEHMNYILDREPSALINDKEFVPQPDERRFVNYLRSKYPDFSQIHFHSLNTIRHGLTILQRTRKLPI